MSVLPSQSQSPVQKNPKISTSLAKNETLGKKEKRAVVATKISDQAKIFHKGSRPKTRPIKPANSMLGLYWRLAVFGPVALALVGGIFFSSSQLKKLVTEIEQRRGQMVALSQRGESLRQLEADLALVKTEKSLIEKAFPKESQMIEFLNSLERFKQANEVVIETVSFTNDRPRADKNGNYYVELVIKANAQTDRLEKFSQDLIKLPYLVKVKMIDIVGIDEATSSLILKAWIYVDPDFFLE